MADKAKDSSEPKTSSKKKEEATVLLTPEELRKISGGAGVGKAPPIISPDTAPKKNG